MIEKPMSNKSPEMIDAIEKSFPGTVQAISENRCPLCKRLIGDVESHFKDELSRREYSISGICQKCQDSVFGG